MVDRIIGAFTFRQGVYNEVKTDTSFTQNAWLIVAVVALISQFGGNAARVHTAGIGGWLGGTVVGTLFAIGGFALACYVVVWLGKTLYQTTATFEEMVRVLGLAYVWQIVGILGIVGAISLTLGCVTFPILLIAALLGLAATLVGLKAALGLDWTKTIVIAVCAFIILIVVGVIAGGISRIFG